MTFDSLNLRPAAPEIFLLAAACAILMVDLFLRDRQRYWSYTLTLLALGGCAALVAVGHATQPVYALNGMFVADPMGDVLKVFACIGVGAILVYSQHYARARGMFRGELFTLALFATLGMMVMISAASLLSLYLGLELLSLTLYSMVALQRDSTAAIEAAMKYFVLGALASGMLLYGMSMVYGATGTLQISAIAQRVAEGQGLGAILMFGLVFMVAGLGFKLGAAPFHMWVPDVYQGAPTAVAVLIGSAPKLAVFAIVMRILAEALGTPQLTAQWQGMLAIMAVLSLALGNVTAIAQSNLKRMLGYSTIAHMGFLLLGVLSGQADGYASAMFYAIVYMLMNLAAFGVIMLLSREGFEADQLDDFKGLNQRDRWYALVMLLTMFSMAGIPPLIGFWAKLAVLQAALEAGYPGLVVVAVLFSLVGAYYYLRIVKLMYFDDPTDRAPITTSADQRALITVNGLAVLLLGIMPGTLLTLCQRAIEISL